MSTLQSLIRNARTALARPRIAFEYAHWALQKSLRPDGPVRTTCGVRIGSFNGFSEFHSFASGVSDSELAFLRTFDFGAGVIIDVGANLGLFSLVMNERYPGRRIVALEPGPSTFAALRRNTDRNAASNIECHQLAVANRNGTVSFVVRENARANSGLVADSSSVGASAVEVAATTLDSFVSARGIGSIALLKIDVEGFESLVLEGAREVLEKVRPRAIYFEVCPALSAAAGFDPAAAAELLEQSGYSLGRIRAGGSLVPASSREARQARLENWVGLDVR